MVKRLVGLVLLSLGVANCAYAACSSAGNGNYYCPSTGDPIADGEDLWQFINNQTYACGSTILLDAGAEYVNRVEPLLGPSFAWYTYGFPLKQQSNCNGAYTTITSTRANELPEGKRVSPADKPKMAKLLTRGSRQVIEFHPSANNWRIVGIALSNTAAANTGGYIVGVLAADHSYGPLQPGREINQIVFDRVLVYPYEEEVYGDLADNTNGLAYLRTGKIAFYLTGHDVELRNSYIYGFTGYAKKGDAIPVDGATTARPSVLTAPGISAALGLASVSCPGGCDENCCGNGGCRRVVLSGATGNWLSLNGPKYLRYVSANTVEVNSPRRLSGVAGGAEPYDGSGKGALTGTVVAFGTELLTQYGFLVGWGGPYRIINNHIEVWGMNIFLGGTDPPPIDPAIVQPGSTATSLVLDHVRELKVGDLIAVDVPEGSGPSTYCTNPGDGCWLTVTTRVGKVTAIDGTMATVVPPGSDGIDVVPRIGGQAAWRGMQIENIEVRRNSLYQNEKHLLADAGKGPMEVKQAYNGLVDGNIIGPSALGNYFITTRNQTGRTPWMTTSNFTYSNNLVGGPDGSSPRMTMQLEDDEHSNVGGTNVTFYNNLHPNVLAKPYTGAAWIADGNGLRSGGWLHNTNTPAMGAPVNAFLHFDCQTSPFVYGVSGIEWQGAALAAPGTSGGSSTTRLGIADNLWGGGTIVIPRSPTGDSCWPNAAQSITRNLFVDTLAIGVNAIMGAWPGNFAVSDYAGVRFKGPCTVETWEDCALADDSPGKGAASDGKDIGADIPQIKDRINGWSEDAGLLVADTTVPAMVNNPTAFDLGPTEGIIQFRLIDSAGGNCTLELFTNGARTISHPDSDTLEERTCARNGNELDGSVVRFHVGRYTPLNPGATYYYSIRDGARVMVGEFGTPPGVPVGPPLAPTGLTATAGNAVVNLGWTASVGAASYNVKRGTTGGGPYTVIATNVTVTSYADQAVTRGMTYYYVVTAQNAIGSSDNSNEASATPQAVLLAPLGLTAKAANAAVNLGWTASVGATSYNVKRGTTGGGPYTVTAINVTVTSYADKAVTNGTAYYYVVTAQNAIGGSDNSNEASATPTAQAAPLTPLGLTATPGKKRVTLSWRASTGASSYKVKRSMTNGGPYTVIATGVASTKYNNTGLLARTTYYYVISAVNAAGESADSNQASAKAQ